MVNQPTLPVDRPHDLPPRWDGRVVVWDDWDRFEEKVVVFICPPPKASSRVCQACGSFAPRLMARGRVAVSARATLDELLDEDRKRSRLPVALRHKIPAVALYELTAFRCPDCLFDQVVDGTRTVWDLDETDYLDSGSLPPT